MADWHELLTLLVAWLIVAVLGGLVGALFLWRGHFSVRTLLPARRRWEQTWLGVDVWMAFLVLLFVPPSIQALLKLSGFFDAIYLASGAPQPSAERMMLWSTALAMPVQVALIFYGLWFLHDARPYLGLTRWRLAQHYLVSYLSWLPLAPLTLLAYWGVALVIEPEAHPLTTLSQQSLLPIEWVLLLLGALIAAPVLEELVFRGVLMPWLTRASDVGHGVVAATTVVVAFVFSLDREGNVRSWLPTLFALIMLPGYVVAAMLDSWRESRRGGRHFSPSHAVASILRQWLAGAHAHRQVAEGAVAPGPPPALDKENAPAAPDDLVRAAQSLVRVERQSQPILAIYSSALLFAVFHSGVWPTPIPLLLLGIGLGWLRYRTRSLVAPIVLHLLFNAVSCVTMLLPHSTQ